MKNYYQVKYTLPQYHVLDKCMRWTGPAHSSYYVHIYIITNVTGGNVWATLPESLIMALPRPGWSSVAGDTTVLEAGDIFLQGSETTSKRVQRWGADNAPLRIEQLRLCSELNSLLAKVEPVITRRARRAVGRAVARAGHREALLRPAGRFTWVLPEGNRGSFNDFLYEKKHSDGRDAGAAGLWWQCVSVCVRVCVCVCVVALSSWLLCLWGSGRRCISLSLSAVSVSPTATVSVRPPPPSAEQLRLQVIVVWQDSQLHYFTVKVSFELISPTIAGSVSFRRQWHCFLHEYRFICGVFCTSKRTVLVYGHTHTAKLTGPCWGTLQSHRETDARIIVSPRLYIHLLLSVHLRGNVCLSLTIWFPGSTAQEFQEQRFVFLCRQIWYHQFFHFIPNVSGDLKLLRIIVVIKRPERNTQGWTGCSCRQPPPPPLPSSLSDMFLCWL